MVDMGKAANKIATRFFQDLPDSINDTEFQRSLDAAIANPERDIDLNLQNIIYMAKH